MTESLLQTTAADGVLRIALDRPNKRNALSRELIRQLHVAVDGAAGDESVRLVVLVANGPAFCAGMDIAEMQDRAGQPNAQELWQEDTQVYRDLLVAIVTLTKPTLAVVQGPALAGGMGLAMACDLVLATDDAVFGLPEPKRGITAAVVAPLVSYRAGLSTASYLLLSGKNFNANESRERGLCHQVVSSQESQDRGTGSLPKHPHRRHRRAGDDESASPKHGGQRPDRPTRRRDASFRNSPRDSKREGRPRRLFGETTTQLVASGGVTDVKAPSRRSRIRTLVPKISQIPRHREMCGIAEAIQRRRGLA